MSSRRVVGQLSGRFPLPFSYDEAFAGNGVLTQFTLTHSGTIYLVEVGGQIMRRNVDFVIDDDTVIFAVAPPAGADVGVHFFRRVRLQGLMSADSTLITADNSTLTADSV